MKTFRIYRPYRLRDMDIGEKGFVNIYDCFFNENLFAIPLGVRVYDHIEKEEANYFFSVRRVGKGLKGNDFDVDFSLLKGREFEETPDLYIELVQKNKKLFLILERSEYNPIVVDDLDEYPEDEREAISSLKEEDWKEYFLPSKSLEELLKEAIEEEDFMRAARIQKRIKEAKKNSKQGD